MTKDSLEVKGKMGVGKIDPFQCHNFLTVTIFAKVVSFLGSPTCKHCIFDPWLVESADAEPVDMVDQLYLIYISTCFSLSRLNRALL